MNTRSICTAVFLLLTLVFYVTAIPLPITVVDNGTSRVESSLWELCTILTTNDITTCRSIESYATYTGCERTQQYYKAARAFQIIAVLVGAVAVTVAVCRGISPNVRKSTWARAVIVACEVLIAVMSVIGWGAAVALFTESFCSGTAAQDLNNSRVGSNQILFVVGFIMNLVAIVLEWVLSDEFEAAAVSDKTAVPTSDSGNTNNNDSSVAADVKKVDTEPTKE